MLTEFEGTSANEVGIFNRLLQHRRATGIPSGAVFGRWAIPEQFSVRPHAIITGVASRVGGEIDDIDAVDPLGRVDGIKWTRAAQRGRRAASAQDVIEGTDRKNCGDRGPARVGRNAAIGLEGIDEITLITPEDLMIRKREGSHEVPLVLVQIAPAADH